MTSDEATARAIVDKFYGTKGPWSKEWVAAIAQALQEQRERDAKVAESKHVNCRGNNYQQRAFNRACQQIAAALRAEGQG